MHSPNQNILSLGGVIHTVEDIQRKFNGSIIELADGPNGEPFVGHMKAVGAVWTDVEDANKKVYEIHHNSCYVLREFPRTTVFPIGNAVYMIKRIANRQWVRGVHRESTEIMRLSHDTGMPSYVEQVTAAFNVKYTPFEDCFISKEKGRVFVLSDHLWLKTRNGMANLFYDDIFIGLVDKDKTFIPHDETITLAEEAIDDLRLKVV